MNYKRLYHELNRRRKIEIDLCYKSILKAAKVYDKLIEIKSNSIKICEIRRLHSDLIVSLEEAYQALLTTDNVVEEMCIDENTNNVIIYTFKPDNIKISNDEDI